MCDLAREVFHFGSRGSIHFTLMHNLCPIAHDTPAIRPQGAQTMSIPWPLNKRRNRT